MIGKNQVNKIRKQWLALLIANLVVGMTLAVLMRLFFADVLFVTDIWETQSPLRFLLGSFVVPSVWAIIAYRCAYRKPGTAYLSFTIVASLCSLAFGLFECGRAYFAYTIEQSVKLKNFSEFSFYISFLYVIIEILWIVASFRLRKVNLKVTYASQIEKNRHFFDSMDSFSDHGKLQEFYFQAVRNHPGLERMLTRHYKLKSQQLSVEA